MSTFDELLEVFGGSLFPEDHRADLSSARQRIDSTTPHEDVYGEATASHDLICSVYHAFCGNNCKAYSIFDNICNNVVHLPRRWELRCVSYQLYHLTIRRFPAVLRFRIEESSISQHLHSEIFSWQRGIELIGEISRLYNELNDQALESDNLEAVLMAEVFMSKMDLWMKAFKLHPAHPRGPWSLPKFKEQHTKQLVESIQRTQRVTRSIMGKGHHHVVTNVAWKLADLCFGCDDQASAQRQGTMIWDYCICQQDTIGQALCKVLEADMNLSPPFSSPIALNLIAIDGSNHDCDNSLWDSCEDMLSLVTNPATDQLYRDALELFEQENSPRGCGAVMLRQAAILISRLASETSVDMTTYRKHIAEIEELHSTALSLFGEDTIHIQIIKAHQVILMVLTGNTKSCKAVMEDIGIWGKESHNEVIAHFLGLLIMRFGRRQMKDHNQIDIGLSCYNHAETLFRHLQDTVAVFQVITARATIHDSLQDELMTKIIMNESIEALEPALLEIDRHIKYSSNNPVQQTLSMYRQMLGWTYDVFVKSMVGKYQDDAMISRWQQKKDDLGVSGEPSIQDVDPNLTDAGTMDALARMLHPEKFHGLSTQSIVEEAKFTVELGTYRKAALRESARCLSNFDVDRSTKVLREFCKRVESNKAPWSSKVTSCIMISFLAGDQATSAKYLSNVEESEDLLYITNTPIYVSQALWCRNIYETGLLTKTESETLLSNCVMAHDWGRAARMLNKIVEASPGYLDPAGPDGVLDHWNRCVWAALIAEYNGDLLIALERYIMAKRSLLIRHSRSGGTEAKLSSLSALQVNEMFHGLSRTCLRCGRDGIDVSEMTRVTKGRESAHSWEEAALMFLEQGRSRTLLQSISNRQMQSTQGGRSTMVLSYKQRLKRHLETLPPGEVGDDTDDERKQELTDLDMSLNEITIEQTPPVFVPIIEPTSSVDNLHKCLDDDTLLIELGLSAYQSMIIAATASGIQYSEIMSFRRQDIRDPVYRTLKKINEYKILHVKSSEGENHAARMQTLTFEILDQLERVSHMILEPIADLIKSKSHVVFSAGHPFVAFPFAALPFDEKPLFISTAISTTPSLSIYAKLSSQSRSFIPKLATVTKPALSKTEQPLPLAAIESMLIAKDFNTWPQIAKKLSGDKFCSLMEDCTIMHIGTHGAIHADSPWLSYISLKKKFRVIDLVRARSKAALVTFAACESGRGSNEGDEVLGFANAVLEAGAMSFLGALWEVDDTATMIMMIYFYRTIRFYQFSNLDPNRDLKDGCTNSSRSLAQLWRLAMSQFYHTDVSQARGLIDGLMIDLDRCRDLGRDPDKILKNAKGKLSQLRDEINVDFKHPYFFASFALTGYGGLICELLQDE